MTASRDLVSFTTQRTTGHSVPCNCHTHREKSIFKMSFPPLQADWVWCVVCKPPVTLFKHGWRKKTMVVGGAWQRQTPHDPWAVGVGRKLPNANMGA